MVHLARSLAPAATLFLVALPAAALATVVVPRTIEEMAKDSACVVRGRVLSSQAAWDEKHERIWTITEVEVLDQIHGPADTPKRVSIRTLGGEVGTVGMKVAGTEKFTMNEEVLVFLRHDPLVPGTFQVVGMSQGKYHIEQEPKGRIVAVPSTEGLAFVKRDDTGVYKVDPSVAQPDRIPLVELRKRVVDAVQAVPRGTLDLKAAPQGNAPTHSTTP